MVKGGLLTGQKVVFTGFRDKDLQQWIESEGGEVTNTVSKNTNILLVAKKSLEKPSSKIQKAQKLGIEVLSVDQFLKKYKDAGSGTDSEDYSEDSEENVKTI